MQTRKRVLYCFYKVLRKKNSNLKRHNCVYKRSSNHTYRTINGRTRTISVLLLKNVTKTGNGELEIGNGEWGLGIGESISMFYSVQRYAPE